MPSWLIIGASRGMGLEYIRQLSEDKNITVFGTARDLAKAPELVELAAKRSNVHALAADYASLDSLLAAAKEVSKITGGSLDVLVNNGAFLQPEKNIYGPTYYETHLDEIEYDYVQHFRTNVLGPVYGTNAFLPLLRKGQQKKIINISSAVADVEFTLAGVYQATPYSTSKAALNMISYKYAMDLKKDGFAVLALHPGMVKTDALTGGTPSKEVLDGFQRLQDTFHLASPGHHGPIEQDYAVKHQIDTINRFSVKDTGAFLSYKGDKVWLE